MKTIPVPNWFDTIDLIRAVTEIQKRIVETSAKLPIELRNIQIVIDGSTGNFTLRKQTGEPISERQLYATFPALEDIVKTPAAS